MLALGAGLLTLALIGLEVGVHGLVFGLILACLPVPLYVGLALWVDRYEPEPPGLLLAAFAWGACIAVFVSYLFNTANSLMFHQMVGDAALARSMGSVLSAPLVEEVSKGLGLFLLFLWKRKEFDGIVDGVVYASMVALGFAMTENIQYYGGALSQEGVEVAGITFVLRGVLSPYAHPLFTCMTGIGIGWAVETRHTAIRWLAPPGGLLLAILLHGAWNLSATLHIGLWLLTYLFLMLPCALGVGLVLVFALHREGNLLRQHLSGEIEQAQLKKVSSVWGRIGFSLATLFKRGPRAWLACEQYLQVASELAFCRHRQQRGQASQTLEEQQLLQTLMRLQAQIE